MIEFENVLDIEPAYQILDFQNLVKGMPSVITLDIAPLHTGVVVWDGNELHTYYFHMQMADKENPQWLYLKRKEFKSYLYSIVKDHHYDYCLVEDVHAEQNYDTLIQLLNINNVIDELADEGFCSIGTFYRMQVSSWQAKTRKIYKQSGKLTSKVETQGLLAYLNCPYYNQYKDLTETQKKDICFEDTCDALGMLLAVVAMVKDVATTSSSKRNKLKFSNVKMLYVEYLEDCQKSRDKRFKTEEKVEVTLKKNIKASIEQILQEDTEGKVFYAELPVNNLGSFGMKYHFTFYASGKGYLLFYLKSNKK